jgi:transposase
VRQYREHLSNFPIWDARAHAAEWLVFPENVGAHLSLDEVAISQGELYTVLTNKARHGKQGALVAIVKGTKTEVVSEAVHRIPRSIRETVQTVQLHEATILNYFDGRRTNASAESFNAKIKNFRTLQRGVREIPFFLYRLSKIYG